MAPTNVGIELVSTIDPILNIRLEEVMDVNA
jgi:hypothetical protein